MSQRAFSPSEQAAYDRGYREGIQVVLDYASRTATAIETTSKRHVHEGFAVAALRGLVEACAALLIRPETDRRAA